MTKSDIGIYGLGVMGRNLALNIDDHGFRTSVFNQKLPGEETVVEDFISGEAKNTDIQGFDEVESFTQSLKKPTKILLMVKAGTPVDKVIDQLSPLLNSGDILIDGGNSNYTDTNRRTKKLSSKNIRFVGMGVSGGEEGARYGPSLMPGGDEQAWPELKPILQSISAITPHGTPCCNWMGSEGAGHFAKMVHNGIEYGIMQLIAECYHLMKSKLEMPNDDIRKTFNSWNTDLLDSYLLDITVDILQVKDDNQQFILDSILDKAGQKGTGRWTALTALELGIPAPLITEAVFARTFSSFKDLREDASRNIDVDISVDKPEEILDNLSSALLGGTLVAFAEGFWLLKAANKEFGWQIPFADVANVWRGGCIIRSALLQPIAEAYEEKPELSHLLLAPSLKNVLQSVHMGWRSATSFGLKAGIPLPAMSAALSHFDALRAERLPANLIQAQRDYFGAHQYERTEQPRGEFFHTNWKEK